MDLVEEDNSMNNILTKKEDHETDNKYSLF